MSMTTLAFVLVPMLAQQPAQKYADGQDLRVCGEVVTARPHSPSCETTLRVKSAGEEFDVLIPFALQKTMATEPLRLRGGQACFNGKVSLTSGVPRITASSAEITTVPDAPPFGGNAVLACGGAITMPRVLKEQKPQYTQTAMRAGVAGSVEMEAVVDVDGSVSAARVITPLHPELDEQAMNALKEWKFVPGTKDGAPVPVLVTIEMTFALRSRR